VVDYCEKKDKQPYICDTPLGSPGVPVLGTIHMSHKFDVAVWELGREVVDQLPNRRFLTVLHADRAGLFDGNGLYYVHGYPGCWSSVDEGKEVVEVRALTYCTTPYSGDTRLLSGYDPKLHVLLAVSKNCSYGTNAASRPVFPPELGGISGSSIWKAYHEGTQPAEWSIDDLKIVAVGTHVYGDCEIVRGTRWAVVNQILWQQYPELRQSLSIITPP
jgi:hypothetical protein